MRLSTAIYIFILTALSITAFANNGQRPDNQEQNQNQEQHQGQHQVAKSKSVASAKIDEGAISNNTSAHTGPVSNTMNLTLPNDYGRYREKAQFNAARMGNSCIGSACESTSSVYIQGQHDEHMGSAIQLGVVIPFTFGGSSVRKAMRTEAEYLLIRNEVETEKNLRLRERHQADMAGMCLELHKVAMFTEAGMPLELKTRCAQFEHNENVIRLRQFPNHGAGYSDRQVSPHSVGE